MTTPNYAEMMRCFGECNNEFGHLPDQVAPHVFAGTRMDGVFVEIDCWEWAKEQGLVAGEFDVDIWDALKLTMTKADPDFSTQVFFKDSFGAARNLIKGGEAEFADCPVITLKSFVEKTLFLLKKEHLLTAAI